MDLQPLPCPLHPGIGQPPGEVSPGTVPPGDSPAPGAFLWIPSSQEAHSQAVRSSARTLQRLETLVSNCICPFLPRTMNFQFNSDLILIKFCGERHLFAHHQTMRFGSDFAPQGSRWAEAEDSGERWGFLTPLPPSPPHHFLCCFWSDLLVGML